MSSDRAQRLLAALTPAGITANQAHLFWSCAWETADALLKKMAAEGLLWPYKHRNGSIGYFRCREDAEAVHALLGRFARKAEVKPKRVVKAAAEIIIPDHVKVQVCPPFEGHLRFKPKGPIAGGFFTDWVELRAGSGYERSRH